MVEPLDCLKWLQSKFFYMGIPNLSIIDISTKIIYGEFGPYIIFLELEHCYSGNGSNVIQEIIVIVISGV